MGNEELKKIPASVDAEIAVLGGVMLDNSAIGYVLDACAEGDFYVRHHRLIFRAILSCDEKGVPFDPISLAEELNKLGELENVGGLQFLGSLVSNTPSAANIKTYARVVKEKSLERQLISTANKIADIAFDSHELTPYEKIDAAGAMLMELTDDKTSVGPIRVSQTLPVWLEEVDRRFNNGGGVVGIQTGFADIDEKMSGLNKSDLIIIAGRPSMGKTTLAMNIAENVSVNHGIPVAVFSLEMPTSQLTDRMVSSIGTVLHESIRTGKINDDDWHKISSAAMKIKNAPLFIDDTASITIPELRNRARRLKSKEKIELIIVDYLQLVTAPKMDSKNNEIGYISKGLKAIAKELSVPVIALAQLNREVDKRTNKRPMMSDLRDSGSIEQDADVIAFVYRDEVYDEDSADKGTAEVIFRKQRNGTVGTVRMAFNGEYSRFRDLDYYR